MSTAQTKRVSVQISYLKEETFEVPNEWETMNHDQQTDWLLPKAEEMESMDLPQEWIGTTASDADSGDEIMDLD